MLTTIPAHALSLGDVFIMSTLKCEVIKLSHTSNGLQTLILFKWIEVDPNREMLAMFPRNQELLLATK